MTSKVIEGHKKSFVFPGIQENSFNTFIYESNIDKNVYEY